jgi:hypothetical protein
LLIESGEPPRAAQLARIGREPEPDLAAWVARIDEALPADRTALRLPLLDLALPALRRSAPPDHARFRALCRELAAADPRTSLAELALERSLERHLDPHFGAPPAVRTEVYSLRGRQAECSILLSAIARAAQPDEVAAASAFAAGAGALAARGVELRLVTAGESSAGTIAGALDRLRSVAPPWQ